MQQIHTQQKNRIYSPLVPLAPTLPTHGYYPVPTDRGGQPTEAVFFAHIYMERTDMGSNTTLRAPGADS